MLKHSIPFPLIQKIKIICHYFVVKNFHLPNSEILVTRLRVFCGVYVCVWGYGCFWQYSMIVVRMRYERMRTRKQLIQLVVLLYIVT